MAWTASPSMASAIWSSGQTVARSASQPPSGGGGADACATKLNATGPSLLYSTYLGGNSFDSGNAITVDTAGNAYVTGSTLSTDFPTTAGAVQTTIGGFVDAFVAKLDATGSPLVYSTYLGGTDFDEGFGIAVDAAGDAFGTRAPPTPPSPPTAAAA